MATVAPGNRETVINLVSASAGPFNLGFRLFDADAVHVFIDGVKTTAWGLSATFENGFDDSATVTLNAPAAAGSEIVIQSALRARRAEDYVTGDPGIARKMNVELARLWSSVADVQRDIARAVRGFSAIDPAPGVDLETVIAAEDFATQAVASAAQADAAAALAINAQENLFDAWRGAWVTATAYARGDLARQSGTTYICLIAHTSGTFSTDLSNERWAVFAQQGSAGTGTGDLLAANNLSDVANAATARSNLGAQQASARLSEIASITPTKGRILVADGSGWVHVGVGSNGQVLVADSAEAAGVKWASEAAIGVGQAWQDLTASRSSGTSYQNTTGRPIQVIVSQTNSSGNNAIDLQVSENNSTWITISQSMSNSGGRGMVTAIIPDGIYYRANLTVSLLRWAELR